VTRLKTKIAAAATVVGLGGIAGLALGQSHDQGAAQKSVAEKPVVHTKVIKRTIHVTKHAKPKHPHVAAGSSSTGEAGEGSTYSAEPVTTSTSGAAAPPVESESSVPVTTSTSGAGASPAESESSATVTTSTSGGGAGGGSEGGDGGGGGRDD